MKFTQEKNERGRIAFAQAADAGRPIGKTDANHPDKLTQGVSLVAQKDKDWGNASDGPLFAKMLDELQNLQDRKNLIVRVRFRTGTVK